MTTTYTVTTAYSQDPDQGVIASTRVTTRWESYVDAVDAFYTAVETLDSDHLIRMERVTVEMGRTFKTDIMSCWGNFGSDVDNQFSLC